MRLLVEHRRAHLGHLALAELLHAAQRVAGVGDVVGDEDAGVVEVDEVRRRRQDARHLEALVDARVELDVHRVDVLHRQGVAEGARR